MPLANRKTIVVNQTLSIANPAFSINLNSLSFKPTYMIIRQLLYCNVAGADSGTYLIWSNISSDYLAAVYVGIQGVSLCPETICPLGIGCQTLNFRVTPANVAFGGPTGQLTMVLEFVQ